MDGIRVPLNFGPRPKNLIFARDIPKNWPELLWSLSGRRRENTNFARDIPEKVLEAPQFNLSAGTLNTWHFPSARTARRPLQVMRLLTVFAGKQPATVAPH